MTCQNCGREHLPLACDDADDADDVDDPDDAHDADDAEQTPPIIMRQEMDDQLVHLVIEAATEWYGGSANPFHPSPSGRRWQIFIRRLSQLSDLRKAP